MRGGDVNSIREQLYQILPDDNLSRKDIDNISDRLINLANELTLSSKSYDFTLPLSRVGQESLTPTEISRMQKEIYPNNTKRHIFDFVEETAGINNNSQQARNTNNTTTEPVIKNISDISDPERTPEKTDNTLKNDGSECLESVPEISRAHQAEQVTQLTNRLQSIKTSTPQQSMSIERSLNPKQDIFKLSFSSINNDDQENKFLLTKSQVEKQYMSDLVNVINKWIRKLPISLNNNKVFWETMMKDLAGDIIDKQKYLQLNPEAKISDDVELEHLKYQVFRWLNKILDVNNLSDIIRKTGSLMSLINNIPVPQLAKPIGKRQETKLTQGLMPNYLDALQDEISLWFGDMSSNLYTLTDSRQHQELIKELAEKLKQVFSQGYNESYMDNEISKWLSKVTRNRVDKENLSKVAQLLKNKLKNKGFTDESSWIMKQDSSQFVEENLLSGIFDWLKGQSLYQNRNSQEKRIQENLASTLAKELKNALECVYVLKADINTDEVLTKVIMKHLQTFPMEPEHKTNKNYIRNTAEQLLRYLKDLKLFRNISDKDVRSPDNTLLSSDENLIGSLPLNNLDTSTNKSEFDRWKKELMTRLKPLWQQYSKNDAIIKEEIKKNVAKFPIDTTVEKNPKFISDKGGQLLKQLETAPSSSTELSSISKVDSSASNKVSHKKSADYLYDSIENWCEKLQINGNTPENIERIKTLKPYIASKLINKIGELNLNPEIFNDDVLYEDMLQDEIDNLLCTLPPSHELENNKPEIKRSLLVKIKEIQKIIRDKLAGQAYKRQLHDTILRTLPSTENLSSEEQASFETLKESLADAYINLRYATNNEKLKNLFKNKIANEIHRFCDDYLKRHPATPIDSKKLNQELFEALHKVPIPKDEIMKSEVEQVKIKDEVNNWVKNLPLLEVSGPKLLLKSKIVNFLTKCLHDIEKEKEIHPDIDYDDKMQKEIKKWLIKLPLSSDKEDEIEDMIKKFMTRLKNTKHSRKLSVSLTEQSIDDDLKEPTIDSYDKTSDKSPETTNNGSYLSRYAHDFPSTTLSTEDKAHMHIIRERNLPSSGRHIPSRFGPSANNSNRDANRAGSPLSVDVASQTELRPNGTELYNSKKIQYSSPKISNGSPQTMTTSSKVPSMKSVGSQVEISPQIIVKEYFWDTTSTTQGSGYKFPQMSFSELPCSFTQNSGLSCTSASQRPHEMSWSAGQNQSLSPGPCILLPPSCITQQPSPKAPCVSTQQQTCSYQSQQVPLSFQETPPHLTDVSIDPTPKRVCMRKDLSEPFRQPNLKSTDASRNLSSTERPEVGTSRSFQKKNMAHHGSFENAQHSKECRSQASKAKRSKNVPDDEDFDCSMRFADIVEFWDSSSRRKIYQIPSEDIVEPFIRKTIRKEEKVRCRCQERILTKPVSRKSKREPCQSYENLWRCSKCRGIHCPNPSRFYFK
ncbi:uncharacterized protein LOC128202094 [Galleria mellonella]|uniref:Uncharacterized protein LOC128202094 n=1 Tax=Galleria mellonella TaxID=7137 RepID=A0ABM3N0Q4_GALME|nr:uncharacterized protein LOC128202094 [Galleria mellonella]